jgi:cytochrome c553
MRVDEIGWRSRPALGRMSLVQLAWFALGAAIAASLALAIAANAAPVVVDLAKGRALAEGCRACHNASMPSPDPGAAYHVPRLGGQNSAYLEAALKAYKAGLRKSPIMEEIVAPLTEGDFKALAVVLGTQEGAPHYPLASTAPGGVVRNCGGCHGLNGIGRMPEYPTLAGQEADYLLHAMEAYRSGARQHEAMTSFLSRMPEAELREVATYFALLKGLEHRP